jgi:hypothetical protein
MLLDVSERADLNPILLWRAFPMASSIRDRIFKKYIGREGHWRDEFIFYLIERFSDERHKVQAVFGDLKKWNSLSAGMNRKQIFEEIHNLCDWIEAFAALNAFSMHRYHRPTTSADIRRASGALFEIRRRGKDPTQQAALLAAEADWHRKYSGIEGIETDATFLEAMRYAARFEAVSHPIDAFENCLFRIWPIVLHGKWTTVELWRFFRDVNVDIPGAFATGSNSYLKERGLRSSGASGNGREIRSKGKLPGFVAAKSLTAKARR